MIIKSPTSELSKGNLILRSTISYNNNETVECFYSVPEKYASFADTISSNCFLVGFLYPALRLGEDIHVEGVVSSRLLYNINQYMIPLLTTCNNLLKPIKVTADATDSSGSPNAQVIGTGFSGGIDAFTTIYEHFVQPTPKEFKLTHLFFFNVGAHGIPHNQEELEAIDKKFHARYEKLKPYPQELGLDFIPVNSNLHLYHPWGHLETCTFATISAVMFLQNGIGGYYLASSGHPYQQLWHYLGVPNRPDDLGMLNLLLLPWMSTESLKLMDDGTLYDRSQKTELIADYEPTTRHLNVCYNHDTIDTNCSICGKCCRTLLTLELLGKLDNFRHIFDIDKYRQEARRRYIAEVIVNEDKEMFHKHVMDLARKKGIDLRKEINCLDILRAKLLDGKIHNFIRNNPLLKRIAKKFF